jgi:hypothetical protein
MPTRARQQLVSQQAINVLTIREKSNYQPSFTPRALIQHAIIPDVHKFEHYANPMVHPVSGETILSYKKLMNDPAMAEVWQTAFGKDFGGMAQCDNKTGQKRIDAMFVMTHNDIKHALKAGKKFTYCNPVVHHHPQKEDPNRIQLTAGGNLIHCNEELLVLTAGLETAKLHWNSFVGTAMARYMCIDLKNFYLTAKLEYYEYMTIPLAYFPPWIVNQYNLNLHALNGKVHLELRRVVWILLQAGILANKQLQQKMAPLGTKNTQILRDCGTTRRVLSHLPSSSMILA